MASRTVFIASVLVMCMLAFDGVSGRVLLQRSRANPGLSTIRANAAAAFINKAMQDVADPNNGNGVVTAKSAKSPYAAPQGTPQEISRTTYGGSGGSTTVAQANTADKVNNAATPGSTAAPKTTAGVASKVIPQTTFKAAPAAAQNGGLTRLSQQASDDIQKDGQAIAVRAGL